MHSWGFGDGWEHAADKGAPDSCGRGSGLEPFLGVPRKPVQRKGELADQAITEFQSVGF